MSPIHIYFRILSTSRYGTVVLFLLRCECSVYFVILRQSDVIRKPQGQIEVNATSSIARGDGKQVLQVRVTSVRPRIPSHRIAPSFTNLWPVFPVTALRRRSWRGSACATWRPTRPTCWRSGCGCCRACSGWRPRVRSSPSRIFAPAWRDCSSRSLQMSSQDITLKKQKKTNSSVFPLGLHLFLFGCGGWGTSVFVWL